MVATEHNVQQGALPICAANACWLVAMLTVLYTCVCMHSGLALLRLLHAFNHLIRRASPPRSQVAARLASSSASFALTDLHLQIVSEGIAPVKSMNVPDVWYPASGAPIMEGVDRDYIVRYTAFVCHKRDVNVKVLLCSADEAAVHIDGQKVRTRSTACSRPGCAV